MTEKEEFVLSKYEITKDGKVFSSNNSNNNFQRKELKLREDKDGYYDVGLVYNDKGDRMPFRVHRLMALKFLPEIEGHDVVNHKDLDKKNNSLDNIEWSTVAKNTQHGYDNQAYDHIKGVVSIEADGTRRVFPSTSHAARFHGYANPTTVQSKLEGKGCNPIIRGKRIGLYFEYVNNKEEV